MRRRSTTITGFTLFLLILALTVPFKVGVGDTFMHILSGRYILEHSFPQTDPFSYYGTQNQTWYDHEWLTEILFALLYDHAGPAGLIAYKVLCLTLTGTAMLCVASLLGASHAAQALVAGPTLFLLVTRASTRPHLLGQLALATLLLICVSVHHGHWRPVRLWWLVPLLAVWAQCHGSFVVGLSFAFLHACLETFQPSSRRASRIAWLVLCGSTLACMVGPNTYHVYLYPFEEMALERILAFNREWQPPHRGFYYSYTWWLIYVPLLATLWWVEGRCWPPPLRVLAALGWAAVFALSLIPPALVSLQTPDAIYLPQRILHTLLWVELALLLTMAWPRRACWYTTAMVAAGVALSFLHSRAVSEVAILLVAPALAAALTPHLPLGRHAPAWMVAAGLTLATVLTGGLLWERLFLASVRLKAASESTLGYGLNIVLGRRCVLTFLQAHDLSGNLLTPSGADIALALWPRVRVMADPRLYVYGAQVLSDMYNAFQDAFAMVAFAQKTNTDMFMGTYRDLSAEALQALIDHGWRFAVMTDSVYLLLSPYVAAQASGSLYAHIFAGANMPVTFAGAPYVLTEATRALQTCPDDASFAWAYLASALYRMGRTQEADEAARRVPKVRVLD